MFGPVQIFGSGRWRVFGVKHFSCALPLDFIRRVPPLNHGHETSWWRELFFLIGRLSRLDLLNHGGLVALLYDVHRRVRWQGWSVESYCTHHWLLGLHPLLKCSAETEEFSTLDKEVHGPSYSILVEVRMSCASAIEHLLCRQLWLIAMSAPLCSWLRVMAGASATAAVVVVPSSQ
jgi:hypothetical protein